MNLILTSRNIGMLFLILSLMVLAYCATPKDDRSRAESEIERRAEFFINRGKVGRDCSHVNYNRINRILSSMKIRSIEKTGLVESDFYVDCVSEMKLMRMTYYADYNVVSGVYRCEKGGLVRELQLSVRLEPRSVPQKDDCEVGSFPASWNIPVGEATMFPLP